MDLLNGRRMQGIYRMQQCVSPIPKLQEYEMAAKIYGPGWCMEMPEGVNQNHFASGNKMIEHDPRAGDLQDGMLAYYLSQAGQCDANVDHRLDREPFDFRDLMKNLPEKQ
jgi:hypothetical protein